MTAVRAVLIATIILGLAATPLVAPVFGGASSDEQTAYAAFSGGTDSADRTMAVAQQNNNNGNNNNNDNGGNNNNNNDNGGNNNNGNSNNNNGNDNGDDNGNGNDNDDDDDDNGNGNGNGNGNDNVRIIVRRPNESVNRPTKCFDTREVGVVQLGTGSYDVTVTVMPHSSFNQTTRLTLSKIDPATGPAVSGGTLVDSVMYQLRAQSSCDGADINPLPNLVNMGIVYNVPNAVDKSKLQIVMWNGSSWTNIDTVPDPVPGNPYVSATINMAGTYALIQRP